MPAKRPRRPAALNHHHHHNNNNSNPAPSPPAGRCAAGRLGRPAGAAGCRCASPAACAPVCLHVWVWVGGCGWFGEGSGGGGLGVAAAAVCSPLQRLAASPPCTEAGLRCCCAARSLAEPPTPLTRTQRRTEGSSRAHACTAPTAPSVPNPNPTPPHPNPRTPSNTHTQAHTHTRPPAQRLVDVPGEVGGGQHHDAWGAGAAAGVQAIDLRPCGAIAAAPAALSTRYGPAWTSVGAVMGGRLRGCGAAGARLGGACCDAYSGTGPPRPPASAAQSSCGAMPRARSGCPAR